MDTTGDAVRPDWQPAVGEWVTYRAHHGAQPEDGQITELLPNGLARVRYRGEHTAKATRLSDLRPGMPSLPTYPPASEPNWWRDAGQSAGRTD